MGRPRGFDEREVLAAAAALFSQRGYEATSIDDLVSATGLHRGSLYQAFGSKRGVFLAALRRSVTTEALTADGIRREELLTSRSLDLLLVAAVELAPRDRDVRELLQTACALLAAHSPHDEADDPATLLGRRLLHRAGALPQNTRRNQRRSPAWRT